MDRPRNPTVRALLREATMDELLALREVAWQNGLLKLSRATAIEIRWRTEGELEDDQMTGRCVLCSERVPIVRGQPHHCPVREALIGGRGVVRID